MTLPLSSHAPAPIRHEAQPPLALQQEQSQPPLRDTPIGIIVDQNAARQTGGLQRVEVDGVALLASIALAVAFAALACWLWWSRMRSPVSASEIAAQRLARTLGLAAPELQAVQHAAEACGCDPAAMLLSETVYAHAASRAPLDETQQVLLKSAYDKVSQGLAVQAHEPR